MYRYGNQLTNGLSRLKRCPNYYYFKQTNKEYREEKAACFSSLPVPFLQLPICLDVVRQKKQKATVLSFCNHSITSAFPQGTDDLPQWYRVLQQQQQKVSSPII